MSHFQTDGAPVEELQAELGRALDEAIDKQGGKVASRRRQGFNPKN